MRIQRASALPPSLSPKKKEFKNTGGINIKQSEIKKERESRKKEKTPVPYALQTPMKNPQVKKKVVMVHRNPTPGEKTIMRIMGKKNKAKQKTLGIYCACARNKKTKPPP